MEGYRNIRAKLYDARISGRNKDDIAFYIEEAQKAGSSVLDLACGTGRVLIPLAESGLEVVGLEISSDMLDLAREKVAQLGNEIQARIGLIEGDMCDFSLDRTFSTILIPYRSFQHILTPEDQRRTLLCIKRHLADDGLLIIHIGDPKLYGLVSSAGGTAILKLNEFTHPETGNRVIVWWRRECNLETQIANGHYIYEEVGEGGETVSRDHVFDATRHTFRNEMRYLLELCGFQILDLYGDFHRGSYRSGGEQVWLARKAT